MYLTLQQYYLRCSAPELTVWRITDTHNHLTINNRIYSFNRRRTVSTNGRQLIFEYLTERFWLFLSDVYWYSLGYSARCYKFAAHSNIDQSSKPWSPAMMSDKLNMSTRHDRQITSIIFITDILYNIVLYCSVIRLNCLSRAVSPQLFGRPSHEHYT